MIAEAGVGTSDQDNLKKHNQCITRMCVTYVLFLLDRQEFYLLNEELWRWQPNFGLAMFVTCKGQSHSHQHRLTLWLRTPYLRSGGYESHCAGKSMTKGLFMFFRKELTIVSRNLLVIDT